MSFGFRSKFAFQRFCPFWHSLFRLQIHTHQHQRLLSFDYPFLLNPHAKGYGMSPPRHSTMTTAIPSIWIHPTHFEYIFVNLPTCRLALSFQSKLFSNKPILFPVSWSKSTPPPKTFPSTVSVRNAQMLNTEAVSFPACLLLWKTKCPKQLQGQMLQWKETGTGAFFCPSIVRVRFLVRPVMTLLKPAQKLTLEGRVHAYVYQIRALAALGLRVRKQLNLIAHVPFLPSSSCPTRKRWPKKWTTSIELQLQSSKENIPCASHRYEMLSQTRFAGSFPEICFTCLQFALVRVVVSVVETTLFKSWQYDRQKSLDSGPFRHHKSQNQVYGRKPNTLTSQTQCFERLTTKESFLQTNARRATGLQFVQCNWARYASNNWTAATASLWSCIDDISFHLLSTHCFFFLKWFFFPTPKWHVLFLGLLFHPRTSRRR